MSGPFVTDDKIASLGSLNLGAGAQTVTLTAGRPINIRQVILVITTAQTTAACSLSVGVRGADGASNSVTKGTASTPATMAVNTVFKMDIAQAKSAAVINSGEHSQSVNVVQTGGRIDGYQSNAPGELVVQPGSQFWLASAAGGAAGVCQAYVIYREQGNTISNFTDIPVTLS